MKNICRTCLSSSNELAPLEIDETLIDKIALLTTIQISQDSQDYPSTICQNCIENVNKYYCFRIIVIKADKELKDHYQTQISNEPEQKKLGKRKRKSLLKDCVIPKKIKIQKYGIHSRVKNEQSSEAKKFCDRLPTEKISQEIFNGIEAEIKVPGELVDIDNKNETYDILSSSKNIPKEYVSRINNSSSYTCAFKHFSYRNNDVEPKKSPNYISYHDLSDEENTDIKQRSDSINEKENGKNHITSTCEECNLSFSTRAELINHKRSLHTAPGICNICGAVVRADNLSKHVQTHSEEPVVCKICGKLLKNSQSLRTHLLIHRGTTYTCDICGRTSKVKSEHSRHMKTHVDPNARKTMCTICGKRVRHLKHHLLTHTGEKPHVCRHCNKGFTSTYSLKVHSRRHTNEKPFICECCSMGFNQKISLMSHLKSKHGAGSD